MKFIELKKHLEKEIKPAYLISGNDRFLCYSALDSIKKAVNITIKDMNEQILSGEAVSRDDILRAVSMFPFIDKYRLVQVNDYNGKVKSKTKEDELVNYLKNPIKESVLVFFNLEASDAVKPYLSYLTHIDCDKLEPDIIKPILLTKLKKQNKEITASALDKLVLYCNNDMSRISSELEKLISYVGNNHISEKDVDALVYQDKEYQVFELAEFIANGNKEKALDLVYTLSSGGKSGFSLLAPLYSNYRRALFVAVNKDKTDEENATLLGVKPYAIKMVKNQINKFTPKKLKAIVDMLYETDRNIKMGKMKEEVAIKTTILNILKIRG